MMNENLMDGIEFGIEPPPAKTGPKFVSKYAAVIAAARAYAERIQGTDESPWVKLPGLWPVSAASNWRTGKIAGAPEGDFDAVVRNLRTVDDIVRTPQGKPKLDDNGQEVPARRERGELFIQCLAFEQAEVTEDELGSLQKFL